MKKRTPLFPLIKGKVTRQAHVNIPEGTFEQEHGRQGFFGNVSHLFRAHAPTGWSRIEGPLKPRCYYLGDMDLSVGELPARAPAWRRRTLYNNDVALWVARLSEPMDYFFRNADGDDVLFVHAGQGTVETEYGPMTYRKGDYVIIPRGTGYRLLPEDGESFFLIIESMSEVFVPDHGPLGINAIFDPAVLDTPDPAPVLDNKDGREWEMRIKREGEYTSYFFPFNPMDVVGWKGDLCPVKINVEDIRPVMSHRYHLPPSAHTTFLADHFVICTFLPRPFEDEAEKAQRVPFYHSNIDYDEVLFYHEGDFFSRDNVKPGMITWHPQGFVHGPHPSALKRQWDKDRTDEIAVMVDTYRPLKVDESNGTAQVEFADYWKSWGEGKA